MTDLIFSKLTRNVNLKDLENNTQLLCNNVAVMTKYEFTGFMSFYFEDKLKRDEVNNPEKLGKYLIQQYVDLVRVFQLNNEHLETFLKERFIVSKLQLQSIKYVLEDDEFVKKELLEMLEKRILETQD